jgi:hypothetical protein
MLERSQDVCPMLISQIDIRNLWPRKKETIEIDGEHVVTVIYIYISLYIYHARRNIEKDAALVPKKEQNDCKPLN